MSNSNSLAVQLEFNKKWALWSKRQFQLKFPSFDVVLYEGPYDFALLVLTQVAEFPALAKTFHEAIRPITCPIRLVDAIPSEMTVVNTSGDFEAELWLLDDPITQE